MADETNVVTMPAAIEPLNPSRFVQAEMKRNVWRIFPKQGTTLDDVRRDDYFNNVFGRLTPFDLVEVLPEDSSYYAELLITSTAGNPVGGGKVRTVVKTHIDLSAEEMGNETAAASYQIAWKGPHGGWTVTRLADSAKVFEKGQSKGEAQRWLTEHLRAFAA